MFILGTAQFGFAYAGSDGDISKLELTRILSKSKDLGVRELDTAAGYGFAEERLGYAGVKCFSVSTKLPTGKNSGEIDVN